MQELWTALIQPMTRILMGLTVGLLVASIIEGLQWTRPLARLAAPLVRLAHLGSVSGAAFAVSVFSSASANAMLGDAYSRGEISGREVLLSNLFNSLPAWFSHTPTIFFFMWPVLGLPAVVYVCLTLITALVRTLGTVLLGRLFLPVPQPVELPAPCQETKSHPWRQGLRAAWKRFRRRAPRLLFVAAPVCVAVFYLQKMGVFQAAEDWMAGHLDMLPFLKPESLGIIIIYMAAELGAAVAAAGTVLQGGSLATPDVVMALLIGNLLATPMRAIRHQIPAYTAYFPTGLALRLVVINQGSRALCMAFTAWLYWIGVN